MEPLTINRFLVEWKKLLTSVKYGGKMLIWERKNVVEIKHGGVTAEQFFYDERSCVMFAYLTCHSLVLSFVYYLVRCIRYKSNIYVCHYKIVLWKYITRPGSWFKI